MGKRTHPLLCTVIAIVSFVAGLGVRGMIASDPHAGELRESEITRLRDEATGFFYDTARRLVELQDPNMEEVSEYALDTWNRYRDTLETRCWLVDVYSVYGAFSGLALFPSGDVFQVGLSKRRGRWELDEFRHVGAGPFYHDLGERRGH